MHCLMYTALSKAQLSSGKKHLLTNILKKSKGANKNGFKLTICVVFVNLEYNSTVEKNKSKMITWNRVTNSKETIYKYNIIHQCMDAKKMFRDIYPIIFKM